MVNLKEKKMKKKIYLASSFLALIQSLQATIWTTPVTSSVSLPSGPSATVTLPQFDTSLGTLVSVQILYGISFTGIQVTLNNLSGTSVTGSGQFTAINYLGLTSSASLGSYIPSHPLNISSSSTTYTISATSSQSWIPGTLVSEVSDDLTTSLSGYQGSGNFTGSLGEIYYEGATIGGSGNNFTGNTPTSLFYGTVSYEYISAVPEPSTWISASMLLVFVGGTAGRSYWRQAKAKA